MPASALHKFLDEGLLDLGEDPTRFSLVIGAAKDLAAALKGDRALIVRATIALVGQPMPEEEPLVRLCDEKLKVHWPTYRNRFPNGASQLFRAMLYSSLADVTDGAEEDERGAECAIAYYTAASLLPASVDGREDALFRDYVENLRIRVEADAVQDWTVSRDVPSIEIAAAEIPSKMSLTAPAKDLQSALRAAVGPIAGNATANPAWPAATEEWATHFSKAAADAVAVLIVAAAPKLVSYVRKDLAQLTASLHAPADRERVSLLRSELLFWKETLFSSGAKISYRRMSPDIAVYWTARDLHEQVLRVHPEGVEYLLRETLRDALGSVAAEETRTLGEMCQALAAVEVNSSANAPSGSVMLSALQSIELVVEGRLTAEAAQRRAGIPTGARVSRTEWAVWLFRDFQTRRLVAEEIDRDEEV